MLPSDSTVSTGAPFSYEEYGQILRTVGDFVDYPEAAKADQFTILRHDVEFSVPRAHKMAALEHARAVSSTFFFQVLSSAYNPFSVENRTLIEQIRSMGHRVGLHLYVSHIDEGNWEHLHTELANQKQLLETGLGLTCDRFSFHRPPRWVLENRANEIGGLLNAYGASFFEFSDQPEHIRYIADSKHQWSYGHPLDPVPQQKLQILIHPDEWSDTGSDPKDTFRMLIDEHRAQFIDTVDRETQRFKLFRDELE